MDNIHWIFQTFAFDAVPTFYTFNIMVHVYRRANGKVSTLLEITILNKQRIMVPITPILL